MGYNTDPNNEQTNKNLEKMGKDQDNTNKGCFAVIIAVAALFIAYMVLNPIGAQ